ncbi:MAG: acyl-CoA dehydrogenase family protein [Parvibaculales bacterium]
MDLAFTDEQKAFRAEVRSFMEEKYPADLKEKRFGAMTKEDFLSWHRILADKGWIAPSWPKEYGGPGWDLTQRYIFDQELGRIGGVNIMPFGITMLGPVLQNFGTEEQKAHYLPRILDGSDWWCQGYSEPGSGSDLASLKTKAERDGDDYIVNGHKIWTTMAQYADWIFCLVRTDNSGKPQQGISFLLIDMNTPGIEVRPIYTIDGGHHVNEVFFTDVRVPVANLVGEEGNGWGIAKFLLVNERSNIAEVMKSKKAIEKLKNIARAETMAGDPLITDESFTKKIAELEVDLLALEFTELRALSAELEGTATGLEASFMKIRGTEIQMRVAELTMEAMGNYAMTAAPFIEVPDNYSHVGPDYGIGAAQNYFGMRKTAIYGGSNEIQKNIIAKFALGV